MNTESAPPRPSDGSLGFDVVLESVPGAGSLARRQIERLRDRLPKLSLRDLQVLVSELVNNSVVHGSGRPIELKVRVTPDGLTHGTVSDGGAGPVEIASPRHPYHGGLGLLIVDALASRWGVDHPSSDVWFELAPAP